MDRRDNELPGEVKAALEDLRRIREVVLAAESAHPFRVVLGPLMLYTALGGVAVAAFGVTAQLLLDSGLERVAGLAPRTAVWIVGGIFALAVSALKPLVISIASRRAGYDFWSVSRSIFTPGYARTILAVLVPVAVVVAALVQLDAAHMTLGVITMGVGAIWTILPTLVPLRELTALGLSMIVLGALATFLFPEWTFYKLAVIWGVPLVVGGLALYGTTGARRGEP